jgi:hypothetical protein
MNSKPFFKFLSEFGLAGRFGLAFFLLSSQQAWAFSACALANLRLLVAKT